MDVYPPAQSPRPYDGVGVFFFVSYKREEFHRIHLTLSQVTELGYRIWWDKGIPGGDDWNARIAERIESCAGMIVFLSEAVPSSAYIANEIRAARDRAKPIVPILLDDDLELHAMEELVGEIQMIPDTRDSPSQELEKPLRYAVTR